MSAAVCDDAGEHVVVDVLDVDVVDPAAPVAKTVTGIASAESEVPGVEQEADVRELEHLLDLPRRLDERAGVVMERRLEAARPCELRSPRHAVREPLPAGVVETDRRVRGGAARKAKPLG